MNRRALIVVVAGISAAAIGSSVLMAGQANRPGLPTIARMYVLNKERAEAIPVTLQAADTVPVTLIGPQVVGLVPNSTVVNRVARQAWEYQQLPLRAGVDATAGLNAAGQEGWEAVGVVSVAGSSIPTAILLKRPR